MLADYLLAILISFLLSVLSISLLRKIVAKYNILKLKEIPLVGGIGIGASFITISLAIFFLHQAISIEIIGIIIGSMVMLVFGIIDDWRELSILAKFLIQIIATTILIIFGIHTKIIYFTNPLNIVITYIWILAITNAFNHLDVLDGSASGIAILVGLSFFMISYLNHQWAIAIISLVLTTATLGFFIFNFPPARVYMGNCGSHFLGFTLAAIALGISYAPLERKVALFSPLLILGFPLLDTGFLILMRLIKRKLPFKKSNDHLALRFLSSGYSKKKTLLIMLALALFFCFCGVLISQLSNSYGILIIVIALGVSLVITKRMSRISVNG